MAQVVRWYLCPLILSADNLPRIAPALMALVPGRWQGFFLPGKNWALLRVRGDSAAHDALNAQPGVMAFPRNRVARWSSAPLALRARLTALGFTVAGDPWPDEVLDLLGQWHQDAMGGYDTPWARNRFVAEEEAALNTTEQV